MLKKKALRKIIITTFSFLIVFVLCIVPEKLNSNKDYLDPKIDVEYVSNLGTNEIYLLGPNNYLVKTNILLEEENLNSKIRGIIDYLTVNKNAKIPTGLSGIIPTNTKLNNIELNDKIAILDFSKELLNTSLELEERVIEAITYSVINLDEVAAVTIKIDGNILSELPQTKKKIPEIITRDFGINKVFDIDNLNSIQKVTLYYMDKISNNNYYVPVTKYLNDDREKINIIIESLSSNYIYESSLVSLLNQNTELINYELQDEIMTLNFNQNIFTNNKLLEEVTYTVAESVCDTYKVKSVIFEVNGEILYTTNQCYSENK